MEQAAKPTRQNRTITVDFHDEAPYFQLLGDTKAFVEFVLAFLLALGFQLLHKTSCSAGGCLTRHWMTNMQSVARDAHEHIFASTGALAFANEHSGSAALPAPYNAFAERQQ